MPSSGNDASAAEKLLDNVVQADDDESRMRLEDLAHLLGTAADAADATVSAGTQLVLEAHNDHHNEDV